MPTPAPQPPGKSAPGLWPHTPDWLADHPRARQIVREVWDTLDEEDRAGRDTTALRQLLLEHQPTPFFFRVFWRAKGKNGGGAWWERIAQIW